ncbi:unnamed protein product [Adineta steineri]|uniref:G-protein coupled receptors family 1 profile domain-containing protein n=1 Tax=Adineta steineri TaxID=433720 RepID=A0A818YC55_9BILA|nr:unnamed protein product [Adineta steineri]
MSASLLSQVQLQMIRIGLPICVSIGNLGCILGLFVFLQKSMRNNPCITYLIGYMITNLIYIDFTVLSTVFSGYGMDISTKSNLLCCIRMYMSYVFSAIPSYFLVIASMDRMFVSSSNINIRQRSNKRFALFMVIVIIIFWILFHLHAFFFSEIQLIYGVRLSCTIRSGSPASFIAYYGVVNAIIPITLMTGFGIQTLINIKRVRLNRVRSREHRLIPLLILQISIYIFLRLPTSLYLVYAQITNSNIKSSNQILIEQFVYFIVIFCQFTQVCISPLMNLISNSFRKEFQLALKKMVRRRRQQRRNEIGVFCNHTKNVNTIHKPEMTARSNNNANHIQPLG